MEMGDLHVNRGRQRADVTTMLLRVRQRGAAQVGCRTRCAAAGS